MALKQTNKNRKKDQPLIEEPTIPDSHEDLMVSITNLTELNRSISTRTMIYSVVGVTVGIALLLLII